MTRFGFLSSLLFAAGAIATSYTDSKTGITFSSYQDSDTGCLFGMAMPEDPDKDFIGQIVAPVTDDKGWAGLDLGSTMTGRLLIVAWPYSNDVVSSLRKASGYVTPPVYSSGNVSLASIEKGTFVNSTHFSYTFLCSGCITGDALSFTDSETATVMSWAYSDTAVTTPSSDSSALSYHTAGYGEFEMNFTTAKSADYSKWAGMATLSSSNSTAGSNTTSTNSGTNSTSTSSSSSSSSSTSSTNTTATVSNSTYDYIIAGGGPAGIIAAERIAESGASVLLIERGAASTYASGGRSVVSWNDTITQYDVPALGYYLTDMNDTSEYCTDTASEAGCLLGGSSMINALMFVRPQEVDFDDKWPTGWKWSDVSSSADKFYERNPGTINPSADGVRYDDGAYDILSKFFSGNGWSSVNALEEPNSKQQVFSHPTWNIQNGLRAGPTLSYLPFAKALDNFHLQLNTKVIRAVRNSSSITGVEVETSSGRQIINVNAGGRVVLASGALSTPRILFNSGIGPSAQIQIVQSGSTSVTLPSESDWINLPVGEGVKDHPIVVMKFNTTQSLESMYNTAFTAPTLNNTDLFAHGKGPLVEAGQRFNFWTSVNSSDGSTRYIQGTCNSPSENQIQMKVYLTHGLTSSGTLEITSDGNTQFSVAPYFTTDMDKEALSSFLDTLLTYSRAANSTLTYISSGSSNVTGSDLISSYISGSHFVGTAKMGTDDGRTDNGTSVVDTNTKVYGTDNLFVVDASIHPDLPTGNTQAIVMVAAEAAASKILALSNSTTSSTSSGGSASSSTAVSSTAVTAATSSDVLSSSISTAASTFTTSVAASTATSGPAPNYGRCGGIGYPGATLCGIGFTCKVQNPYYSQCVQNS